MDIWNTHSDKEIKLSQNGRFLEFYKRGSPMIFKYDMSNHRFVCIKRSTDEEQDYGRSKTNTWFNCKITTEDTKLGYMFKYAAELAKEENRRTTFYDIMHEYFGSQKVAKLEQWAAIGTRFRIRPNAWGNRRHNLGEITEKPSNVSHAIREYIAGKTWTISELNRFTSMIHSLEMRNATHVDEIFALINAHPQYADSFVNIKNGQMENLLYNINVIDRISNLIETYNMQTERLLVYFNYLNNVESIDVNTLLEKYTQYLDDEYKRQNGRRNKMYKFPCYFMSTYFKQQQEIKRDMELEHYSPDENDDDYEFAYLEYEDEEYKIIIPRSPEDVRDEGRQQGHCVASHFMRYIANGDTMVVFMRRSNDPDRSLITMEIRNNRIRQACIGDNNSVPYEMRNWIRNWASMKGVVIDEDESWRTARAF